jgi:hypothetical protein
VELEFPEEVASELPEGELAELESLELVPAPVAPALPGPVWQNAIEAPANKQLIAITCFFIILLGLNVHLKRQRSENVSPLFSIASREVFTIGERPECFLLMRRVFAPRFSCRAC